MLLNASRLISIWYLVHSIWSPRILDHAIQNWGAIEPKRGLQEKVKTSQESYSVRSLDVTVREPRTIKPYLRGWLASYFETLKLNARSGNMAMILHISSSDSKYLNITQSKKVQFGVTNIYYQIIDSSMDKVLKSMTNIFWSREGRLLLMMVMMISCNHTRIWKIIWNSKSERRPTSSTSSRIQMIWIFVTEADYVLFPSHVRLSHVACHSVWR